MTPLRFWIIGALLLVVLLAVGGSTVISMREVSGRLEADLAADGERAMASLRAELEQAASGLDSELERIVDPRGAPARTFLSGGAAARYLWAAGRLEPGRVDLVKVLDPDATILTSGHWPATLGARDGGIVTYQRDLGSLVAVVDEPTPAGSSPSLQRGAAGGWGGGVGVAVVGRFLDADALERMRARLGVDVFGLCRGDDGACLVARRSDLELDEAALDLRSPTAMERLSLRSIELGHGAPAPALVVGFDRAPIEAVRAGIRRRAIGVGSASALLALLVGLFLARGIVRPVEALAGTAGQLADGDLAARVPIPESRVAEVQDLVGAFNSMAEDIEASQLRLVQAERVAAWREIARGLAHELKNPLTPILGAMDVLRKARKLDRPDFDEILHEQASAVVDEVMRLKQLSDSFAQFARLPDPVPEELDLGSLVDGVVALYTTGDEGVQVVRDFAGPSRAVADRAQLQTVVTNLVKNALEAMDHEGTLTLRLAPASDGRVELRVEDSGPGIPAEVRDRLFTPYFTTKGSRGTGLGLAMAHRIVLEHGGTIEVDEAAGGGAAFVIRLPVEGRAAAPPTP